MRGRGVRQSARRILVSSSSERLSRDNADLWDSGRVVSSQTINIPYQGKPLAPEQRVFWKVEVWDDHAAASGWSASAQWTMAPARIAAQWIAAAPAGSINDGTDEGVTQPMPVFRTQFGIDKPVERALLYASGTGQYEAHINGKKVGDPRTDAGVDELSHPCPI